MGEPHLAEGPFGLETPVALLPGLGAPGVLVYAATAAGPGAKERLARRLCFSLAEGGPAAKARLANEPVRVKTGPLGRPRLEVGGRPGPAVSFSLAGPSLWAVVATAGSVGVDLAVPGDFAGTYPFARAFQPGEFAWARRHCQGGAAMAAAMLWALKEAAVKALGTGFHRHDPREVEITTSPVPWQGGWRVGVSARRLVPAWVRAQGAGWLAIAQI